MLRALKNIIGGSLILIIGLIFFVAFLEGKFNTRYYDKEECVEATVTHACQIKESGRYSCNAVISYTTPSGKECQYYLTKIGGKRVDKTKKYLFELEDGNTVESVVMYYKHGITICISCQVGCRMGCKFCASTIGGLVRSLTPGEILDQVIFAQKDIGERISNIVMMGIGEPLDNFDNVIKFLKNVNDERGINIGYRHISLSTCGIVPKIEKLMELKLPITLSISLHAPTDEVRDTIMPVNHAYNTDMLINMCKRYALETKRRISFEYAIINGVNDSPEHAKIIAEKLRNMLCHVNLIPVNNVEENELAYMKEIRGGLGINHL